jgi:DNA-binding CsgD family transcriptional regulator
MRAAMHLQAARLLADAGAAPVRVAMHLVAVPGAAEGWVRNWLVLAAPALIYQAPQVAAELLRAGLADLADRAPERESLEPYLVRVAFMQGQHEEVERSGIKLLASHLDANRRAEIAWFVAYARLRDGNAAEAVALVEQELARPSLEAAYWARLRALQAMTLTQLGRRDEMQEIANEALASAEAAGDGLAAGYALLVMFTVSTLQHDLVAGLSHVERALAVIGDDPQAVDLRLILLSNRASLLSHLARPEEAITTSEQALAIAEQAGAYRLGFMRTQLAAAYYTAGRWDDALAELETAIATPGSGADRVPSHGLAALIAAHRGDWSAADEHLAVVADIPTQEVVWPHNSYDLLLARAMAADRSGGAAPGMAVLASCLDPSVAELMPDRYVVLPTLTRLAIVAGDTAVAAAALAAAELQGQGSAEPTRSAAASYCEGLVAADTTALLTAAGLYRSAGWAFECAQALEDAAVLLADRGDMNAARDAFTEATGRYEAMGARLDIDRANARLRPHGLRHRQQGRRGRPATGWDALTPTETKIAYLIGEGKSNSDVAARLFLSRTTVHTHVSHILAKLNARSRAEIVREALTHPAAPERATA